VGEELSKQLVSLLGSHLARLITEDGVAAKAKAVEEGKAAEKAEATNGAKASRPSEDAS
jgi:hypothetical protein